MEIQNLMTSKQIEKIKIQDSELISDSKDEALELMFAEQHAAANEFLRKYGVPYFDSNGNIIGARFPPEVEGVEEIIKLYPLKKKIPHQLSVVE